MKTALRESILRIVRRRFFFPDLNTLTVMRKALNSLNDQQLLVNAEDIELTVSSLDELLHRLVELGESS